MGGRGKKKKTNTEPNDGRKDIAASSEKGPEVADKCLKKSQKGLGGRQRAYKEHGSAETAE